MAKGTAGYMAPEVIVGGTPSKASDIYGLGATTYKLLIGKNVPTQAEIREKIKDEQLILVLLLVHPCILVADE